MTNRYYNNDTNIVVDFTLAQASDVENKATDIVAGFDVVETEMDAESAARETQDAKAIQVNATGETPTVEITESAANRASKLVGFDSFGDVDLKTIGATEAVVNTVTRVTGAATLAVFNYYLVASGSYTISLPTAPATGDWIDVHLEDGVYITPPILNGNGNTIASYSTLDLDVNYGEFRIAFNGTEWKV